jgi:bacillithiol biosynthesis cysteine-adding enzyme BshC
MLDSLSQLSLHRVSFGALPAFSRLFQAYCTDYDALADFYAGDFRDPEARAEAADRAAARERDREALVEVLLDQNARWGLGEETRANIEALRDPGTVAVVTGQQVGLLTGPLYTLYKTITAVQLAAQLHRETGRRVVPVFWLEGEDHDLEEVAGASIFKQNDLVELRYTGHTLPEDGNLGSVGRLAFTEQVADLVANLEELLPPTDFRDGLMEQVRAAYRPGTTFIDAFARLMHAWFAEQGLVFIAPDDARLKALAAPLFRRELEDHASLQARLEAASATLAEHFHAQVHPRATNLFVLEGGGRFALDAEDGRFRIRGTDRVLSLEEALGLLEADPSSFSPNVVLRPLMQDLLLPTAAYVAGPGEVAYFAQFKPAYAWAGLPMPVIYPRASVSLVESKVKKVLDRFDLSVPDLATEPDKLFRRLVLDQMEFDVEAVFKDAARHLHQAVNELKPTLESVDRTLVKTAEATRVALMKEMERLKGRVIRAEKSNHDAVRGHLEKAQDNLYPAGGLQERTLSTLYFLNKYSPFLVRDLLHTLSTDTVEHQVVYL